MKFLLTILLIYISYRILKSFLMPRKDAPTVERKEERAQGEETVFDEVCKTYIAKDSALKGTFGGETRYFCSGECMHKFRNTANNPY